MSYNGQKTENCYIRDAAEEDIDRIKQIELESGISNWKIEEYINELERIDSVFWVCELEKKVIGFIIARLIMNSVNCDSLSKSESKSKHKENDTKIEEIEIFSIAIKKDFRKLGLGSKLLERLINENPMCPIYLEVRESNTSAINFYKRHNFNIINRRNNYYTLPTEDALTMTLDFSNKILKLDYEER